MIYEEESPDSPMSAEDHACELADSDRKDSREEDFKRKRYITALQLLDWQAGELGLSSLRSNFTSDLFRLIAKADDENRFRISLAYPLHVQAYAEWRESPQAFRARYDLTEEL